MITAAAVVWAIAAWLIVAWAAAIRLGPILRRNTPPAPPVAVFSSTPAGARWLVCDTTHCARTTTLHVPQTNGTWRCTTTDCGHIKGDR